MASLLLGIETSCDDTACAVVDRSGRVLSSVVSSQLAAHRPYGGVVPEIASREHLRHWPAVSAAGLAQAGVGSWSEIGAVAATRGPGLVGSLLVGLTLGKALSFARDIPFFAVHHLEGHALSPFLPDHVGPVEDADGAALPIPDRFHALVVSGGHSVLYEVTAADSIGPRKYATLLETRDDAIGETFDKFGKRLGLPYPQGPLVDRLAETGDPARYALPRAAAPGDEPLFFSYSGLKTAAILVIERLEREGLLPASEAESSTVVRDLCASFRAAAVAQILDRLRRLVRQPTRGLGSGGGSIHPMRTLAVSGGVAANRLLRRELVAFAAEADLELRLVPLRFSGDNAAMIAAVAADRWRRGDLGDALSVEAASRVPMGAAGF